MYDHYNYNYYYYNINVCNVHKYIAGWHMEVSSVQVWSKLHVSPLACTVSWHLLTPGWSVYSIKRPPPPVYSVAIIQTNTTKWTHEHMSSSQSSVWLAQRLSARAQNESGPHRVYLHWISQSAQQRDLTGRIQEVKGKKMWNFIRARVVIVVTGMINNKPV